MHHFVASPTSFSWAHTTQHVGLQVDYDPNPKYQPQTDVVEEIQRRMRKLLDQAKTNIMQPFLKYKAFCDSKGKASTLETTDYCYILNPNKQATKIPFWETRWQGPQKSRKSFLIKII